MKRLSLTLALVLAVATPLSAANQFPSPNFSQAIGGTNSGGTAQQLVGCVPNADLVTCALQMSTTAGSTAAPGYTRIQDGTTLALAAILTAADSTTNATPLLASASFNYAYNGTTWDRLRTLNGATGLTGVLRVAMNGSANATLPAAAATVVVKALPGMIGSMLVTTAGTTSLPCYDNASAASGTIIGITPPTTTVGQVIVLQYPATLGITCATATTTPVVTISYF